MMDYALPVRGNGGPVRAGQPPDTRAIEIVVRDPRTGEVYAQIALALPNVSVYSPGRFGEPGMTRAAIPTTAPINAQPFQVAGRIEAAPQTDLAQAIAGWLADMKGRRKKPKSVDACRQLITKAAFECGWQSPHDLSYQTITEWMQKQTWKGTTYNRNLSLFHGFTRYLVKTRQLPHDELALADRAENDGDEGSRAATTDEARAMVLKAWIRDQNDRRCKGNRALYWLCLFQHGCRYGEPEQWKRKHLVLDHPVPHLMWQPDINKGRKRRDCALAPELVDQLRKHLDAQDAERAKCGLPPAGPDDVVFPQIPTRSTFRDDRDRCGIPEKNHRGMRFSPHSARKYFATALGLVATEKMTDYLMRHTGRVEHRYFLPELEDQASAVALLPRLWPEQGIENDYHEKKSSESLMNRVAEPHESRYIATVEAPHHPNQIESPPAPAGGTVLQQRQTDGVGDRGDPISLGGVTGQTPTGEPVGTSDLSGFSRMPIHALINNADPNAIADLFDALARLLRQGSAGDGTRE